MEKEKSCGAIVYNQNNEVSTGLSRVSVNNYHTSFFTIVINSSIEGNSFCKFSGK